MVSDKPKLQILIGGLVNWLTDRFGLLVWLVQLDKHRSAKREVQIPASGEKKCCICNTIYKRLDLLAGLSQMSRCLLYAISRWGIEQPRSSFGSISFPFPMKVAVADGGARGARSPPPIIFRSNGGPKGQKNVFGSPPPYLRVWMTNPRLISRFGSGNWVVWGDACTSPLQGTTWQPWNLVSSDKTINRRLRLPIFAESINPVGC